MNTPNEYREYLSKKLTRMRGEMETAERYYDGVQPLSYLDPDIAAKMNGRLRSLTINFARLAVDVLASRITVAGFASTPGAQADAGLWQIWQDSGMDEQAAYAQLDALIYGRAFYLVWTGPDGGPLITAESPLQCAVHRDPLTRQIVAAVKRYVDDDGFSRSIVFTPYEVVQYASRTANSTDPLLASMATMLTTEDAVEVSREPNPMGVVPMVALVNRPRLMSPDGQSELVDLFDPIDGIAKLSTDLMVAAEYSASPRRYATGIAPGGIDQAQLDEVADRVRSAWEKQAASKFILAPDPETRIGQLDVGSLAQYESAIAMFTAQIAAIASLPPTYLSLTNTANPASADAIRSSESRLVAKAEQRQRTWSGPYEDLMRLAVLVRDGQPDPTLSDLETIWAPAAPATIAATADAMSKLYASNLVDQRAALTEMGYSPTEIDRITTATPIGAIA